MVAWLGYQALPKLFTGTAPYLNTEFLLGEPETLYSFESGGSHRELTSREFQAFEAANGPVTGAVEVKAGGGIFPCIIGTLLLTAGAAIASLLVGVSSAIFLNEYARRSGWGDVLRLCIRNLAGVPPVVVGLFVLVMMAVIPGWRPNLLTGWITLTMIALPVVITASEEALRGVPKGAVNGALALGATRWQVVWTVKLPLALPGILTSSLLSVAQVAGETAPLLMTAVYKFQIGSSTAPGLFEGILALPSHIYMLSTGAQQNSETYSVQAAATCVFLIVVFANGLGSVLLRSKLRLVLRQRA
jgi:phosphate transport system permease protein